MADLMGIFERIATFAAGGGVSTLVLSFLNRRKAKAEAVREEAEGAKVTTDSKIGLLETYETHLESLVDQSAKLYAENVKIHASNQELHAKYEQVLTENAQLRAQLVIRDAQIERLMTDHRRLRDEIGEARRRQQAEEDHLLELEQRLLKLEQTGAEAQQAPAAEQQ
jgi:chromosome segregation ATPase